MKISKKHFLTAITFSALSLSTLYSNNALACACGCGILNVATSSVLPNAEGGTAFLQYDYMSQTRNWHGEHKSDGHNHDKRIATQTITAGAQYMFNRDWGAAIRVPYVTRNIKTLEHSGDMIYSGNEDIGDIRVNGIYSGFFDDMSTGIIFGLKLPTGQKNAADVERNQQIGTGSTDAILGAYHIGNFGKSKFGYFAQATLEDPFITYQDYNPGYEVSAATGVSFNAGEVAFAKKITPLLQVSAARKAKDSGRANASHNKDTGYTMAFLNPGIEVNVKQFKLYADVGFPIYRKVNGNQLVPQNLYKVVLSYDF